MASARDRGVVVTVEPIALTEEATIDRLSDVLARLGYDGRTVRTLLGEDAYQARRRDVPVHLRRLFEDSPLATAIRLLFLGVTVPEAEVAAALAPLTIEELVKLGLVDHIDTAVRATVRLVPHADLLLAGSRYPDAPGEIPADYVATATAPSAILANLTVRRRVGTALDIGTGSGIQALWAARHCDQVVAVDVNRRALNLAAFNARLNGVTNIEFREGSLFDPVARDRFDLIVCNAPYVVSPDLRYAYRDGGIASDGFSELLAREAPRHLEDGGFAHLLIGWVLSEEDWAARPRSWVADSDCDCWLLLGVSRDPIGHAALWNQELAGDEAQFGDTLDRWIDYFNNLRVNGVAEGAMILRRRRATGRHWFRADRIPDHHPEPASDHVLRVFAAHDHFDALEDEALLLDEVVRLSDHVRFEQELSCRDGGYVIESMTVVLDDGLGFRAGIDQNTATLLPLLDGHRSVREAIDNAIASRVLDEGAIGAFRNSAAKIIHAMLELGFVVISERVKD